MVISLVYHAGMTDLSTSSGGASTPQPPGFRQPWPCYMTFLPFERGSKQRESPHSLTYSQKAVNVPRSTTTLYTHVHYRSWSHQQMVFIETTDYIAPQRLLQLQTSSHHYSQYIYVRASLIPYKGFHKHQVDTDIQGVDFSIELN